MLNYRKYLNNQNWNIGFAELTPARLLASGKLTYVRWLRHQYRDRFFADPFILDADDDTITVLVEEFIFGGKGTIVQLEIDRKTMRLVARTEILRLDTHLSYPYIIRKDSSVYIMPENSESGVLTQYVYDAAAGRLTPCGIVCDDPLTDATPFVFDGSDYLIATRLPDSQKDAYLYRYDAAAGRYVCHSDRPVAAGKAGARMGGSFFEADGKLYRPAQDCSGGYGKALTIFEVESVAPVYAERAVLRLDPVSWRYNLGLHTLNFHTLSALAVIDSYGYLYPVSGRILMMAYKLKQLIK